LDKGPKGTLKTSLSIIKQFLVFTKIYLFVKVEGDVSEEDVKKALDKAIFDPGTCSIAYMINKVAPIEYKIEIVR
jgi:putative redox protein